MRESAVLTHSSWIDGKDASGNGTYPLIDPRTGTEYARVAAGDLNTVQLALESARRSFTGWKSLDAARRSSLLRELAGAMRAERESLGALLSKEVGKSAPAAVDEVMNAASLLDYFAEENLRRSGEIPLMGQRRERVLIVREPVGVVVAITPFNYPLSTLACKVAPALAVGCTVVAKPDEHTPVSTLRVARMASRVGIPAGVFNVVTGRGEKVGRLLVDHPVPGLISFTGSTEVGKEIMAVSSRWVRRVVLELGGQCPAIVCRDADWREVLPQIVEQSMKNCGQYCYRISRVLVDEEIYPAFLEAFVAQASQLAAGSSQEPEKELGPLNNAGVLSRLRFQVQQAVEEGAQVELGGNSAPVPSGGFYYSPTVLTRVSGEMSILKDEVFGPVTLINPFRTMDEAIRSANATRFGLASYIFTRDLAMALEWADRLEAGSVWVNRIHQAYPQVPFGGMKESGLGREKSRFGMEEYTELKAVYLSY